MNLLFALFPSCVDGVGCASTTDGVKLEGQMCRWVGGLGGMGWGVRLGGKGVEVWG